MATPKPKTTKRAKKAAKRRKAAKAKKTKAIVPAKETESKAPATKPENFLARLKQAETDQDAEMVVQARVRANNGSPIGLSQDLAHAATSRPQAVRDAAQTYGRVGFLLATVMLRSNYARCLGDEKVLLLLRQKIIDDLEIESAAEFMLLDAAMDAYLHWMALTALTAAAYRDGTNMDKSRLQVRMAGMAQSYLRTYSECMKTLTDLKRPPFRVLKVQAGENVAIQINENTKVLEASYVPEAGEPDRRAERSQLPAPAPAATGEADGDPD